MDNLIIITVLCGIIAVLTVAYLDMVRKRSSISAEEEKMKDKARLKSEKILDEARERAMQILRDSRMLSDQQRDEFDKQWRDVIKKVTREFEAGAEVEVQGFRKTLELEAVGAEKTVADRVDREFEVAKQQIEEYKKDRLAKLNAEIMEVVNDTVKKVVGKAIPIDEHKRLIISALGEAKREHIL